MFNNEMLADIYFIVGVGRAAKKIPAHKFVSSVSSTIFNAMFNGELANNFKKIEIPDVEPVAFFELFR